MNAEAFLDLLQKHSIDFFAGVPDSLLAPFANALVARYGLDGPQHIVAQNEGGCVALAAGHHMATGRVPCIYLQNSGIGNVVNPVASLTSPAVYAIPQLFIVGWRGEPGKKDEPQHVFQGEATLAMLRELGLEVEVLEADTPPEAAEAAIERFEAAFAEGRSAAFVVRKGGFTSAAKMHYQNPYTLVREDAVRIAAEAAGEDVIVSTTGKISRELFEIREAAGFGHGHDFLTVGSMGHASLIALGIAMAQPQRGVFVLDGDGAVLMHMGALAVVGSRKPRGFIHILLNNCAHETVGGIATVAASSDFAAAALACGYVAAHSTGTAEGLKEALAAARREAESGPVLVEAKVALGARADLGRPTTTARQNKEDFMAFLAEDNA